MSNNCCFADGHGRSNEYDGVKGFGSINMPGTSMIRLHNLQNVQG